MEEFPELTEEIEGWIYMIRPLPIAEKTLLLAELAEPLLSKLSKQADQEEWHSLKQSLLKHSQIRDVGILNIFDKSLDQWVHISRKESNINEK